MLDSWLIEAENAYRRPFNLEKDNNYVPEEKLIDRENWEEHYVRKGDPSKPTYYIIRRAEQVGLFSNFIMFAGHIRYALSKGWIPVIDMQNYPNSYLAPEKLGKENAWEYYFEQPLRIGLEQAYNGDNIILCQKSKWLVPCFNSSSSFFNNSSIALAEWRMLIKLGLLKVKPIIMEEILATRAKLFAPTDRVMGVHLRGTDYLTHKSWRLTMPPPP